MANGIAGTLSHIKKLAGPQVTEVLSRKEADKVLSRALGSGYSSGDVEVAFGLAGMSHLLEVLGTAEPFSPMETSRPLDRSGHKLAIADADGGSERCFALERDQFKVSVRVGDEVQVSLSPGWNTNLNITVSDGLATASPLMGEGKANLPPELRNAAPGELLEQMQDLVAQLPSWVTDRLRPAFAKEGWQLPG